MRLTRRRRVVIATVTVFIVEWLLFEFLRVPYRPPHDMRTFLGQEKNSLIGVMGVIAAGWALYFLCDGLWPLPTTRDGLAFACFMCVLAAVVAAVVCYPPWPVTPLYLLPE